MWHILEVLVKIAFGNGKNVYLQWHRIMADYLEECIMEITKNIYIF